MWPTKSDQSDDSEGPSLPRGISTSRGVWEGEKMELDHKREMLRDKMAGDNMQENAAVACNLQQFQNHEVGKGYQAKHVIRQKTAAPANVKIRNMTVSDSDQKSRTKSCPRTTAQQDSPSPMIAKDADETEKLSTYLNCAALREFRCEIESLLKD